MSDTVWVQGLPVLAGVAFATIGVCYQAAERRGVPPVRLLLFIAVFGSALFAFRARGDGPWTLSSAVLAWALLAGMGQYACMKLVGIGMKVGPFSGLWCMLAMDFAPVVIYAAGREGSLPRWQEQASVAAALLCCVIASTTVKEPEGGATRPRYVAYGMLLLAVLMLNALLKLGIYELAGDSATQTRFLCAAYVGIGIGCAADMLFVRTSRAELTRAIAPGLAASAGSVCGMLAVSAAVARLGPGAFIVTSIVMLLIPMLAAVLVFRERPTGRWLATLALGLMAVAFSNL